MFGKVPFAGRVQTTLSFIEYELFSYLKEQYNWSVNKQIFIIGGYSLVALFDLWASYESDAFKTVVVASPSVWFTGWLDHVKSHSIQAESVYLSLGNKEEKAQKTYYGNGR